MQLNNSVHTIVSLTQVFLVSSRNTGEVRCVTALKTSVKQTIHTPEPNLLSWSRETRWPFLQQAVARQMTEVKEPWKNKHS